MSEIERIAPIEERDFTRKKVAAYARVSTNNEDQEHSLAAQVSYYQRLIQANPEWKFAGIYADQGISGTTKERPEFQRMLEDAEAGEIDIILTKSVSRFARNTVHLLEATRVLKAHGVSVRFERENIDTLTSEGELMLTILASFAQEEARSTSENLRWTYQKRFERGEPGAYHDIYGYKWVDKELVVVPEEAKVVKKVFRDYLNGKTTTKIVQELNDKGITRQGTPFTVHYIQEMLHNDIYLGKKVMQKSYTIMRKRHVNKGELPIYVVENHHKPLVSQETYDAVNARLKRWSEDHEWLSVHEPTDVFTCKIICAECGRYYHRAPNKAVGTGEHRWNCDTKDENGKRKCKSLGIPLNSLKAECAAAMGIDEFDEKLFEEEVDHIVMNGIDRMDFYFRDGRVVKREWRSTAKKDSWTEERRAERGLILTKCSGALFSGMLFSEDGDYYCTFKDRNKGKSYKKRYYGLRSYKTGYRKERISEEALRKTCLEVIGSDKDEDIRRRIKKIIASRNLLLEFHLDDGSKVVRPLYGRRPPVYCGVCGGHCIKKFGYKKVHFICKNEACGLPMIRFEDVPLDDLVEKVVITKDGDLEVTRKDTHGKAD